MTTLLLVAACDSASPELKDEGTSSSLAENTRTPTETTPTESDADTDADSDSDADGDTDTDADSDPTTPTTTEPASWKYQGSVEGVLGNDWYSADCEGDAELTLEDYVLTGVANCFVGEWGFDLAGPLEADAGGSPVEGVWTIEVYDQRLEVDVQARPPTETLYIVFSGISDWFSFEGTMDLDRL